MTDTGVSGANAVQAEYWNKLVSGTWVELQDLLDRQIQPLGDVAMKALGPRAGETVLDVGCGCGQSTMELLERVGPSGRVKGVDISAPMLEVARSRLSGPFELLQADAQTADLGEGWFDAVFSRFGVMFFENPVAAFANIRKAMKPGARLGFVCWRSPAESPLMTAPMTAAAHLLPPQPPSDPMAPGPFAFADPVRLRGILESAGFAGIEIAPHDDRVGAGDLDQAMTVAFRLGPLGAALRANPEAREAVASEVRDALAKYLVGGQVKMPAAVWIVTALNS